MKKRLLENQKPFSKKLDKQFDMLGKSALAEILEQNSYLDVFVRKDEIKDSDKFFWDVKGINTKGTLLHFDVEVKQYWRIGHVFPKLLQDEGFSIPNRKSVSHNKRHSKTNYIVIISKDLQGAFFVSKQVFETAKVIEKNTIYGKDKFRNIKISSGKLYLKKDGIWQRH